MSCLFCEIIENEARTILYSSEKFVGFYDKYPVNEGHTLLIPRQHITEFSELSPELGKKIIQALQTVTVKLEEKYSPAGFNYGLNDGEAAGQSIEHLHWHIIPRYSGDVSDPLGGVRGVIPSRQKYETE